MGVIIFPNKELCRNGGCKVMSYNHIVAARMYDEALASLRGRSRNFKAGGGGGGGGGGRGV